MHAVLRPDDEIQGLAGFVQGGASMALDRGSCWVPAPHPALLLTVLCTPCFLQITDTKVMAVSGGVWQSMEKLHQEEFTRIFKPLVDQITAEIASGTVPMKKNDKGKDVKDPLSNRVHVS